CQVIALNQTGFAMPTAEIEQQSVISTGVAKSRRGAICFTRSTFSSISNSEAGLTLVELIITVAILSVLATAAVPIARFQVRREKERELRRDLWEIRGAIDRYKDAADKGAFQT